MLKLSGKCNGLIYSSGHLFSRFVVHYSKKPLKLEPTKANSLSSLSNYLVKSLGLSEQKAISTSFKVEPLLPNKVSDFNVKILQFDSVVKFLEQNGFQQSHIQNVVCSRPRILFAKVDKTLKPKFEGFQKLGISESDVVQLVSGNPGILTRGFDSNIVPTIQHLRAVLGSDEFVFEVLKNQKYVLGKVTKLLVPNITLLLSYGIPDELIQKWVLQKPTCFAIATESLKDALMKVEQKWGITRDSSMFLYGVMLLASHSERSIELKCNVFRSFGWTESNLVAIFRKNPYSLCSSEERIKKQLNFLMKEVGYEPSYLAKNPCLMTCSVEKRIAPRHRVLLLLKEKGLVKKDYTLLSATLHNESNFLKKFVLPFKDVVPNLHDFYVNSRGCV